MESITATSRGRAGEKRLIGTGIRTARPMPALLAVLLLMVGPGLPVTQAQPGRAHVGMGGSLPANPANPEQLEGYFRGYCSQRDDAYPDLVGRDFGILNGAEHLTPQRWAERMGPVIERINQLAPTARIMFVSYRRSATATVVCASPTSAADPPSCRSRSRCRRTSSASSTRSTRPPPHISTWVMSACTPTGPAPAPARRRAASGCGRSSTSPGPVTACTCRSTRAHSGTAASRTSSCPGSERGEKKSGRECAAAHSRPVHSVTASGDLPGPGLDGVALPDGVAGHAVTAHDEGTGADGRGITQRGGG